MCLRFLIMCCLGGALGGALFGVEQAPLLEDAMAEIADHYQVGYTALVPNRPMWRPENWRRLTLDQALAEICAANGLLYRCDYDAKTLRTTIVLQLQRYITAEFENASIAEVLAEIQKQAGQKCTFLSGLYRPDVKVSVQWPGLVVSDALTELAEQTGGRVVPLFRHSSDGMPTGTWCILWDPPTSE